jgi:hypothetical protein
MGLHGFFSFDDSGTPLVYYLKVSETQPELYCGMLSALINFMNELTGNVLKEATLFNDLRMRYDYFDIIKVADIKTEMDVNLGNKKFQRRGLNYLITKDDDGITINELTKDLTGNKNSFYGKILDREGRNYLFKFDYNENYKVSDTGDKNMRIYYVLLYDKIDEQLEFLKGDKLVDDFFSKFEDLLKNKVEHLGKAVETNNTVGLIDKFSKKIVELFYQYDDFKDIILSQDPYPIKFETHNPYLVGFKEARERFPSELYKITTLYYSKYFADYKKEPVTFDQFLIEILNFFRAQLISPGEKIEIKSKEIKDLRDAIEMAEKNVKLPFSANIDVDRMKKALTEVKNALKLKT